MNKTLTALGTVVAVLVGYASAAAAQATDPTGGAASTIQDDVLGWAQEYGLPMMIAFFVFGLVVRLLLKFGKRSTATQ